MDVQSVATVSTISGNVSKRRLGFNFDTIVNTADSGQGSLRQFILNSNALSNTNLAQVGQTALGSLDLHDLRWTGSRGDASRIANQLNGSGVASINVMSLLPVISDSNTTLDATTQTSNVGNTNAGLLGTGGTVGVGADGIEGTGDELPLSQVNRAEVQVVDGTVLFVVSM